MLGRFQHGLLRDSLRDFSQKRATALLVLGLFAFQLTRFYLAIPLGVYICPMMNDPHGPAAMAGHDHQQEGHEAMMKMPLPGSPDDGCSFRCCKGTLEGEGLTPAQQYVLPVAVSYHVFSAAWIAVPAGTLQPLEDHLPPPFQPPRNLS